MDPMLSSKTTSFVMRLVGVPVRWTWKHLPPTVLSTPPFRSLGKKIHATVSRRDRHLIGGYCHCHFTRFFRNVPLLEVLRDLAIQTAANGSFSVASIGCSTGAELYSLLWLIRCVQPDLEIKAWGVDLSETVIAKARAGVFSSTDEELAYLSATEVAALFDREGETLSIKPFLRRGVTWLAADALDPALPRMLEPQDLVLANNFLGPFMEAEAENCLRNLARIVKPNGYLVLFGADLDLRTRWVKCQGYLPLTERIEAVHTGDRVMLDWPWTRWGLEPLDKKRADWQTRYAVVFQVPAPQIPPADSSGNRTPVIPLKS